MTSGDLSREFLSEAQEIVDMLNRDLIAAEAAVSAAGDVDPDLVNNLFRNAHSLKGMSGMFGIEPVARLAHALENVLDGMRLGRVQLTAKAMDLLFACVEHFTNQLAAICEDRLGRDGDAALSALETRLAGLAGGERDLASGELKDLGIAAEIASVLTEYEEHRLRENIRKGRTLYLLSASFDLDSFDRSLADIDAQIKDLGEVITKLPSSQGQDGERIAFDIMVGSLAEEAKIATAVRAHGMAIQILKEGRKEDLKKDAEPQQETASKPTQKDKDPSKTVEALPDVTAATAATAKSSAAESLDADPSKAESIQLRSVSQTVRVDIHRLDVLMNLVGELALTRVAFQRLSEQIKREHGFTGAAVDLHKESRNFERRLADLQAGIMEVRMVPLKNLFERMVRVGRKMGRDLGKEIRIDVSGEHTELDKLIVEDLADPLMHLIRNAIDHGIEIPDARSQAGKRREGVICLNAEAKGNHVIVSVVDDGNGIESKDILATAISKGLVSSERGGELSSREIFDLLMLPGFSTRQEVSEYSGRGVGMDVVKTNISKLSGIVDIFSTPGDGTQITVTLPITLAIIPALIVTVAGQWYAIPLNNVLETVFISPSMVTSVGKRDVISVRGQVVPVVRLRDVFGLSGSRSMNGEQVSGGEERREGMVPSHAFGVVAGVGSNKMALLVDRLDGQQDIVIKSLGKRLRNVSGIAGATELGNRKTILVIDTVEILNELSGISQQVEAQRL